jgi:hypothetical protein
MRLNPNDHPTLQIRGESIDRGRGLAVNFAPPRFHVAKASNSSNTSEILLCALKSRRQSLYEPHSCCFYSAIGRML